MANSICQTPSSTNSSTDRKFVRKFRVKLQKENSCETFVGRTHRTCSRLNGTFHRSCFKKVSDFFNIAFYISAKKICYAPRIFLKPTRLISFKKKHRPKIRSGWQFSFASSCYKTQIKLKLVQFCDSTTRSCRGMFEWTSFNSSAKRYRFKKTTFFSKKKRNILASTFHHHVGRSA